MAAIYFLALYGTALLAMLGLHLGRARFTLAPVFAFAGLLTFLIWQLHQAGWWLVWGEYNINAAFLAPTPAILLGVAVVYAMDGLRTARAYLVTVGFALLGSVAFLEFLSGLSKVAPLPSIFYPPLFSQLALAAALLLATGLTVLGLELARRWLPIGWSMSAGFLIGMMGFLGGYSWISYNPAMASENIAIETPVFLMCSAVPMALLIVYGGLAARAGLVLPARPLGALFAIWRQVEMEIREAREDFLKARETIDELRRLNRALETEQMLRTHQVDNSPAAILEVDRKGTVTKVNDAARKLLEPTGAGLVPGMQAERILPGFSSFLHDPDVLSRVLVVSDATGQAPRHVQVTVLPNGNQNYGPAYSVIAEDVTERERQAFKRTVTARVRGIQMTGRVVSHDFSNLMLALESNLDRVVEALPAARNVQLQDTLRAIKDGVLRSRDMLKQLGSQQPFSLPELKTHDIAELAAEAVRLNEPAIRQAHVALSTDLPPGILVEVDRTQIVRVFMNLIGNAVRATPAQGRIEVALRREVGGVIIQIRDTGIGMTPAQLATAYEPGFSTKGDGQGGLGLAISYLIVEAHGGRLTLTSQLGRGTLATILLPLAIGDRPAATGLTILVLSARETLRDGLAERIFAQGGEAIEVVEPAELDAVLAEGTASWSAVVRDRDFPLSQAQELILAGFPQIVVGPDPALPVEIRNQSGTELPRALLDEIQAALADLPSRAGNRVTPAAQ
jgi:signal transduction histidine kinase